MLVQKPLPKVEGCAARDLVSNDRLLAIKDTGDVLSAYTLRCLGDVEHGEGTRGLKPALRTGLRWDVHAEVT